MIAHVRSSLRLQRFEAVAVTLATVVIGGAVLITVVRLRAIGLSPDCWATVFGDASLSATRDACADPVQRFLELNESMASRLISAMAFLPLVIGLLLGVPAVSREIESGTAATMWAVADSRREWLAWRLLAVGGLALVLLVLLGVASDLLWQARAPTGIPNRFDDAGLHGLAVIAKGAGAFGVGALTGAVLGRTLPALITATLTTVAILTIGTVIRGAFEGLAEDLTDASAGFLYDNAEAALSTIVAVAAIAATFLVVARRRPT